MSTNMQLREIVTELLKKKFAGSTRKMAAALDIGEMDLRRLAGIAPGSQRNQEKIFRVTIKLLCFCKEMGIDPANVLQPPSETEVINDVTSDDKAPSIALGRTKTHVKKKRPGAVSARGVTRNRRLQT